MKHFLVMCSLLFACIAQAQNDAAIEAYNQGITQYTNKDFANALLSFNNSLQADS